MFREVWALRDAVADGRGHGAIAGAAWFDMMTEKFAEMKTHERALLGQLTENAVARDTKTLAELRWC